MEISMKLLLLSFFVGSWLTVSTASEGVPVVSTAEGKVSGIEEKAVNEETFYSYYGIPYAAPPVGDLRFKEPTPVKEWEGVRDGSVMPPPCTQVRFGALLLGMKLLPEQLDGQEDCLFLNVFVPKRKAPEDGFPVMVFIHGGGFFAGAADEYLPNVILSKDVVLVVMQYRLGFLGFLSTEDSVMPGNFGLKDQNQALQWVQRNIANFGGDPKTTTIFGESAGGASAHFHMLLPKSKGLFSRAILQSGTALNPWALYHEHAKIARDVGIHVGCSLEEGSHAYLKCMRGIDAKTINAAMQDLPRWFALPLLTVPRIDGDFLPDHPAVLMKEGRVHKVDIITGITADEGAIFSKPMYASEELLHALEKEFSVCGPISLQWQNYPLAVTTTVYNHYLDNEIKLDREHADNLTKLLTDHHFAMAHDLVSEIHARHDGVSTFRYELTYRGQFSAMDMVNTDIGKNWVSHGDELYYLFRGGPLLQPMDPPSGKPTDLTKKEDLRLREILLTLWTNFAAKGHPTVDDSLGFIWEPIKSDDDLRYLALSPEPTMDTYKRKEAREFYYSLPTDINIHLHPHLVKDVGGRGSQDEL